MIRLDVCALTPSLKAAEVIIANKRKKKSTNQPLIHISLWSGEEKGGKWKTKVNLRSTKKMEN